MQNSAYLIFEIQSFVDWVLGKNFWGRPEIWMTIKASRYTPEAAWTRVKPSLWRQQCWGGRYARQSAPTCELIVWEGGGGELEWVCGWVSSCVVSLAWKVPMVPRFRRLVVGISHKASCVPSTGLLYCNILLHSHLGRTIHRKPITVISPYIQAATGVWGFRYYTSGYTIYLWPGYAMLARPGKVLQMCTFCQLPAI